MPELSVDAIGVAFVPPDYQRAQALDPGAEFAMQAGGVAHFSGVPMERLLVLRSELDGESDVSSLALACLGPPAEPQPLFLVRSGPERDPYVVELARIVHGAAWAGEDVGITHLDELGGTLVFDLLDWAVPAAGATVLVCDDPAYVDESQDTSRIGAVAIRLRRGPGPLRVLGCGEGSPGGAGLVGPPVRRQQAVRQLARPARRGRRRPSHRRPTVAAVHQRADPCGLAVARRGGRRGLAAGRAQPDCSQANGGGVTAMKVGVDVLSVSRFAKVAAHHRYRKLVFCTGELARADELGPRRSAERLAGVFCVKEATCKVLGRGFGQGLRWRDIEVGNDSWGAPKVTLHGGARRLADEAGLSDIAVTLTHQVDIVIAVAAAVPDRTCRCENGEPL